MKTPKYITLQEVKLNNNCPECYSTEGLELTFKQRFVENALYKAITDDLINEMHCKVCDTAIFPVRWTDEIEQVVAYQKRAATPKPKSIKLKRLGWLFILADLLVLIVVILLITGVLSF
ncbi:hypothetical protein SAMN04515667_0771 [Formosa sp. Hel1_31_208]|uniref:hypothetical protein n=1 Tax=Formosa sp. Hel1_31_208 TaxID=1798225 RepID=UPI00087C39F5|nr:hypothetical protein [Formosa sp. Hel1_31_208]SDR82667.1 hypothetical protein SAMN04515667_0771 [Formosa sp. Hel1_31_208]